MKILVVSEFHQLHTGYATYYKNICEALHEAGHEVFELASYGNENDRDHVRAAKKCKWTVYLNVPSRLAKNEWEEFNRAKQTRNDTEFGSWIFETIVLDCFPDVVISIRDHWYDKFIIDSPLSRYYRTILSPTVDSRPQKCDWVDTFKRVDYLTSYNQWSEDVLRTQYGGPNIVPHIPMGFKPEFKPLDQKSARAKLGLPDGEKILLTVMRNQTRKKYPELFEAFSKIEDKSIKLYCHTHFQDRGWDLVKLGIQNDILNRVYFSYKCSSCKDISADLLKCDNVCKKCGAKKEVCDVKDGATDADLNYVYNSADLYVQWHNSEGFGAPAIEAAATGLKVITVNYSAQEDIASKIESFPVDPLFLQREIGTLCLRAVPDNDELVRILNDPASWNYDKNTVLEKVRANYDWKATGQKWVDLVNSVEPKNNWAESPNLISPPSFGKIAHLSNFDFVKACILNVLQDESLLGGYLHSEILEHLDTGFFIPENKITGEKQNTQKTVTREMVYHTFFSMLENRVKWEREKNAKLNG